MKHPVHSACGVFLLLILTVLLSGCSLSLQPTASLTIVNETYSTVTFYFGEYHDNPSERVEIRSSVMVPANRTKEDVDIPADENFNIWFSIGSDIYFLTQSNYIRIFNLAEDSTHMMVLDTQGYSFL